MELCPLCAPRGQPLWGKGSKPKLGQAQGQSSDSRTSLGSPVASPCPGKGIQVPVPPPRPSGSGPPQQEGVPRAGGARGAAQGGQGRAGPAAPPGSAHGSAPRMLLTSAPLQLAQRLLTFIDCQ